MKCFAYCCLKLFCQFYGENSAFSTCFIILKCICNEIFGVGIFALSKNIIFSDHFDTNLVEKFRLEVGKFLD